MLITIPRHELSIDYIRGFCDRFKEGIRVEYKSTLNDDVRKALPKVISSFANAYGGVLIIGVKTREDKPVPPIEGFAKPAGEELPLTVENIVHQHVYPLISPLVTEVKSDVSGKVFLVIEVEPSHEAPHAIENSQKVYVRTGNASTPYDLAHIDLIEKLVKRRDSILERRLRFKETAVELLSKFVPPTNFPKIRVVTGPRFPHTPITDRQQVYQFLRDTRFRGGSFYARDKLRRLPEGVSGEQFDGSKLGISTHSATFFIKRSVTRLFPVVNRFIVFGTYFILYFNPCFARHVSMKRLTIMEKCSLRLKLWTY